jgi:hypothetical protein
MQGCFKTTLGLTCLCHLWRHDRTGIGPILRNVPTVTKTSIATVAVGGIFTVVFFKNFFRVNAT